MFLCVIWLIFWRRTNCQRLFLSALDVDVFWVRRTFSIHRSSSMVQLRVSSLHGPKSSAPADHHLNESLPRGFAGWELAQEFNQTLCKWIWWLAIVVKSLDNI